MNARTDVHNKTILFDAVIAGIIEEIKWVE